MRILALDAGEARCGCAVASTAENAVLLKGLPSNVEAEKFVLGSILLSDHVFPQVAGALEAED